MSDEVTIRLRRGLSRPSPTERSFGVVAALGGLIGALGTLVLGMALALVAWFLADAGAHGDTTDALRAGADVWLVGHGSGFVLNGMPLGVIPLGLSALLVLGAFRSARWAGGRAESVSDYRTLGTGVACFAGTYVVVVAVVCVLASQPNAEAGLGRGLLGGLSVAALGGGAGLLAGTGLLTPLVDLAPGWVRDLAASAAVSALLVLAAGAVLVGSSLLVSFGEAENVLAALELSGGDAVTLLVVMALFVPNAALLGAAYLVGPGFAVGSVTAGVGTSVSPAAPVVLGAVPAVPLFAALPEEGPTPGWLIVLCVVPVLCAALGVLMTGRGSLALPYDVAAIRGAASGLTSAIVLTVAIVLAGGALGIDRLARFGAPAGEILLFSALSMVIGGTIGGVVLSWWRRRY